MTAQQRISVEILKTHHNKTLGQHYHLALAFTPDGEEGPLWVHDHMIDDAYSISNEDLEHALENEIKDAPLYL